MIISQDKFTITINNLLKRRFETLADKIIESSQLLQYLDFKTRSVNKGAKARGSFANLYAIYVIIEDYLSCSNL